MTFRAPELFDVKTGITLDEKVDIWVCPSFPTCCTDQPTSLIIVTRVHALRTCVQPLTI